MSRVGSWTLLWTMRRGIRPRRGWRAINLNLMDLVICMDKMLQRSRR
uniref:Uncharacterized protein n=1 Tax=Rhizophora mucronata TaxID=61149 RepID=A0A2P2IQW3_RHIMU